MGQSAYLIVICNVEDHSIAGAHIWSSPEWEQSRCIRTHRVYVAWRVNACTFSQARDQMLQQIKSEDHRYHYIYEHLDKEYKEYKDGCDDDDQGGS